LTKPLLMMIVVVTVLSTVSGFAILSSIAPSPLSIPPYPPWLSNPANVVSASQLATAYSAHNLTLRLPAWLPVGYKLTSVHVPNISLPYGYAIISYSAQGITDPLHAGIAIQVTPAQGSEPTVQDLQTIASNTANGMTLQTVAGLQVLTNPHAITGDPELAKEYGPSPYARFWKDGVYYQIYAYSPLTIGDVIHMISSLAPVS